MKRFIARALIVVASILGIVFAQVAPASADPPADPPGVLAGNLAELWTQVLETPALENPIIGNGTACWDLGKDTIVQFGPITDPTAPKECKVEPGTKIFIVGSSFECSSIDGDDGEPPFTPKNLRECAVDHTGSEPTVTITLDGNTSVVPLTGVGTPALKIDLPEDNIFGVPADKHLSVAYGWVALSPALTPGTYTIEITDSPFPDSKTTIIVGPVQ
jgi:hypothetical protein